MGDKNGADKSDERGGNLRVKGQNKTAGAKNAPARGESFYRKERICRAAVTI